MDAVLDHLVEALESVQADIDTLRGEVTRLTDQLASPTGPPTVSEPGNGELGQWVDWLVDHFDLHDRVPACWPEHRPITTELAALHDTYREAYHSRQARPQDRLHWLEALQRSLARLQEWDRLKCRTRGHPSPGRASGNRPGGDVAPAAP